VLLSAFAVSNLIGTTGEAGSSHDGAGVTPKSRTGQGHSCFRNPLCAFAKLLGKMDTAMAAPLLCGEFQQLGVDST
jgi:hypothetical protein